MISLFGVINVNGVDACSPMKIQSFADKYKAWLHTLMAEKSSENMEVRLRNSVFEFTIFILKLMSTEL